jgi:hypothetical protein
MLLHDDGAGARMFIVASIWCSKARVTCAVKNQFAEIRNVVRQNNKHY